MTKLRVLPQNLINQIAAGEVVERPSSVVKELVENAIDAGATRIQIVMRDGGKSYLSVTDNGKGMTSDELTLAVERHATSKLPDEDLFNIHTLGFRGEALPSIGSVSRLSLISKHRDEETAWAFDVCGGEKSDLKPAQHPQGTKIEVADLFYATPARLKFLKTSATEMRYVVETLNRLALSFPGVHFSLKSDDKVIFDYEVSPDEERVLPYRIAAVMGEDFIINSLEVDGMRDDMSLSGYISMPTLSRSAATSQYLFVNGRPVDDKVIKGALRAAYQDVLSRDRFPLVVLFLKVAPFDVDVNVHPAKTEVRFRDTQSVRSLFVGLLAKALRDMGCQSSTTHGEHAIERFQKPISYRDEPKTSSPSFQSFKEGGYSPSLSLRAPSRPYEKSVVSFASRPSHSSQPSFLKESMPQVPQEEARFLENESTIKSYPLGIPRAQVHDTYLIAEATDGIIFVDQHAAHERLVYEQLKNDLAAGGIKTQLLLIPEVVELSLEDSLVLEPHFSLFEKWGFVMEPFGQKAVLVREIPALLPSEGLRDLISTLIDDLKIEGTSSSLEERLHEKLASMACHGSVRAGRKLSLSEMNDLLRQMEQSPNTSQCNHGRPTIVKLTFKDMEKLFERS